MPWLFSCWLLANSPNAAPQPCTTTPSSRCTSCCCCCCRCCLLIALGSGKSLLILSAFSSAFVNGPFLALTGFRSHRLSFISLSTHSTSTSSSSPFPSPNLLPLLLTPPTIFVTNALSFLFCPTHSSKRLLSTPAPAPLDNNRSYAPTILCKKAARSSTLDHLSPPAALLSNAFVPCLLPNPISSSKTLVFIKSLTFTTLGPNRFNALIA